MIRRKIIVSLLLKILSFANVDVSLSQSQDVINTLDFQKSKDSIAFICVEKVLKTDPGQMDYLLEASRLASNLGGISVNANSKTIYIRKAILYAERSIQAYPNSKEAHLNYIIALGLLSGSAIDPTEKLKHARIIKAEADYLISIDSLYAAAYFALGKWHLSLASLSWFEKTACNFLYGGMPKEASLETALLCFEKAIQLQPNYILFYYNKALTLQKLGHRGEAIETLKYSLLLPIQEPNDRIRRTNCIALLNSYNNK